jgi:hypothetical protein
LELTSPSLVEKEKYTKKYQPRKSALEEGCVSALDDKKVPFFHTVVEFDHVAVEKPDAPMACGTSYEGFLIGSMDVDIAVPCIAVFAIQAIQPQDAAQDEILIAAGLSNFTGGETPLERHPRRGSSTDLGVDTESTGRSLETSLLASRSAA